LTDKGIAASPRGDNTHLKRWITGLLALPLVFYMIGPAPGWLFMLFIFAVAVLATEECYRIMTPALPPVLRICAHIATALFFAAVFLRQLMVLPFFIMLWAALPMTYLMFARPRHDPQQTAMMGRNALATIYVVMPLVMLAAIRMMPQGHFWLFFLLAVIVATDTGAFYCGRTFGRHKLYEAVSPKKTWEGAVGGTILAVFVAALFYRFFRLAGLWSSLTIALAISVSGQIGDLVESIIKRHHGVKDSGSMLPGHGGILDRIDSILFSAPVLYLFLVFM